MKLSEQQADFLNMVADLVIWIRPTLETSGVYMKVYSWNRTIQEQKELLKQGATKTLKSKHIIGLAVDFQLYKGGMPIYNTSLYEMMGNYWKTIGGTWGGEWNKFKDEMHFEYHPLRRAEHLKTILSKEEG